MTATTTLTGTTTRTGAAQVIRTTVLAALVAAVAIEAVVALAHGLGVQLVLDRSSLGTGSCAVGLAMCMVPAAALIAGVRRVAARPRQTFVRLSAVLVILSLLPDLLVADTSAATRVTLMVTHLVAAAIIVPAVARRL